MRNFGFQKCAKNEMAQNETQNNEKDEFADRINSQSDEIEKIQARTFTKALNSAAVKDQPIDNLFEDLRDGKRLLKIVNFFTTSKLVSYWKIVQYDGEKGQTRSKSVNASFMLSQFFYLFYEYFSTSTVDFLALFFF